MPLRKIVAHPKLAIIWKIQVPIALGIYCYAALSASPPIDPALAPNDKVMHFVGNFLLYCSLWLAFWNRIRAWHLFMALIPFVTAMEFGQLLVPSRMLDPLDLIANYCGLANGFGLCYYLQKSIIQPEKE